MSTATMNANKTATGSNTRKMVTLAMLATIAYVVMYFLRIPIWSFLKYDPKDIVIVITGFIYGPLSACMVSVVVSFIEMITASDTGWIGFIMNVLSTCAFACTAAFIYSKMHTKTGAVIGLVAGVVLMVAVMLLWNYLITPLYMEMTREVVASMLIPIFLPFNLLKGGLNTAFALLLYKPLITALRRANLLPESSGGQESGRTSTGIALFALALLATVVLIILVSKGIL